MSGFLAFLKKAAKSWLCSWRGDPFEPAVPIQNIAVSGGVGLRGLFSMLFSTLNSVFSAGAAGFTLVTMLFTTALGVVPVVFDTALDHDSPLSIQASQGLRASIRADALEIIGIDETGQLVLLDGGGNSLFAQMTV